jgi:hypothetical protein
VLAAQSVSDINAGASETVVSLAVLVVGLRMSFILISKITRFARVNGAAVSGARRGELLAQPITGLTSGVRFAYYLLYVVAKSNIIGVPDTSSQQQRRF